MARGVKQELSHHPLRSVLDSSEYNTRNRLRRDNRHASPPDGLATHRELAVFLLVSSPCSGQLPRHREPKGACSEQSLRNEEISND